MIDLCKIFGVEEGEEFKIIDSKCENNNKYVINDGQIYYNSLVHEHYWSVSYLELNEISGAKVIKLPKKKEFKDDELAIMRSLPMGYRWIARDKIGDTLYLYAEKPIKRGNQWQNDDRSYNINIYTHLFQTIQWKDEEPVFIDDYVERGVE
jgi:hypothetical protein